MPAEEIEARTDLVRRVRAEVGDDVELSTADSLPELVDVARVGDEPLDGCRKLPACADTPVDDRDGESPLDGKRDTGRADGSGAADEQGARGQSESPLRWSVRLRAFSLAAAGHGDFEGAADLIHPLVAETAEPFDERSERHALDRVEVDDRFPWDRIRGRLEQHLTRQSTDRRRARPDESPSQPRNRCVSRQHDDRPAPDVG